MPITPFLNGRDFDRETKRVLGIAFEMARVALGDVGQSEGANAIIASKMIEFAEAGETNPDRLCDETLAYVRQRAAQQDQHQ